MLILCFGTALPRLIASEPTRTSFVLAAGDAEVTLEAFSEQSGAQIVYLLRDVRAVTTNPVQGDFTTREALDRMVAGTVLRVTVDGRTGAYVVRRERTGASPEPNNQQPMKNKTPLGLLGAWIALSIPTAGDLAAQTPPGNDEVVTLQEFNVTASTESSYTASDTTTGSRTNTKVKDLPYAVDSLTSDFFKDFSVFDLTEELQYMSSISGVDDSMAFTSRGFFNSANNNMLNGHFRLGLIDVGTVDRVEMIKGPSGSIYGQTNPGGVLSVTTRRPRSTPHQSASVSFGSYDTTQAQFHLTGPIPMARKPVLFYSVDYSYLHRHFDLPATTRFTKSVAGTLLFKPSDDTDVTLLVNYGNFKNPNEWNLPYLIHTGVNPYTNKSMTVYDGYAMQLRKGYYASPVDYKFREVFGVDVSFDHRFNSWLSMRGSYDYYHNPIETYDTLRQAGTFDPSVGTIGRSGSGVPTWSTIYGSGHSYSTDLLAHYRIAGTDQQTLLTVDDYLNNRRDYGKTPVPGMFVAQTAVINPSLPVFSPYVPRSTDYWTSNTTKNNAVEAMGFGLTHQANLFHERLLVYAGYRHDRTTGYQQDPTAAVTKLAYTAGAGLSPAQPGSGRESFIHDSNDASKVGFSYRITSHISWYASRIESFIPFGTSVPLTVSGTPTLPAQLKSLSPAPETGVGYESGLKSAFLEDRLQITADVFSAKRENVGVTELSNINDPSSPTITVNEGSQKSKGFEFDSNFRFTRSLSGRISYTYTDSRVFNQGLNTYANGRRPRATPYDSFSAAFRYEVPEVRGLSFILAMRYQGNTPAESPSTGLITNPVTKNADLSDGRANLRTPPYSVWNIGAAYHWKSSHLDQTLNLGLKNIFNKIYFQTGNNHYVADGRGVYLTYSINR